MIPNSDTTAAIESLETLLKAKIRLQDAQSEAQPVLESVNLLFETDPLNDDQKNVLRNGLKSLRKLLEAHAAYSEAVQQAEPARTIVNQLFGAAKSEGSSANGKTDLKAVDPEPAVEPEPAAEPEEILDEEKATEAEKAAPEGKAASEGKATATGKTVARKA
jgi:hypothetical protein